jgi:hypothetical protein
MTIIDPLISLFFLGITSVALLTLTNLLLPNQVERVREKLEINYVRSFMIGLVVLGFSLGLVLLFVYIIDLPVYGIDTSETLDYIASVRHQILPLVLTLLIILITVGLIIISTIGLAAVAASLTRRIGKTDRSHAYKLAGAALVVLSGLAPYLGWFVFIPLAGCLSIGSTVQAIFQRKTTLRTSG